ncbi:hypothetical protein Tco_0313093, partial [Tanacetum coccineum]
MNLIEEFGIIVSPLNPTTQSERNTKMKPLNMKLPSIVDHKDQRIVAHLGYRKRKVGASWNEGYEVLFILKITKGAKKASRSDVGHVYHLSTDVGGLS